MGTRHPTTPPLPLAPWTTLGMNSSLLAPANPVLFGCSAASAPCRRSFHLIPRAPPRRVAPGVASRGSHRSGRAQLRHPVRPVRGSPSALLSVVVALTPGPGNGVPVGWPHHRSLTSIPLPSPGSPRYRFPCFIGTMEMCDSLRPSRRASLSFAWRYHVPRLSFRSCGPGRQTAGLGFIIRSPYRIISHGDDQGLPGSWRTLLCLCPGLGPRQDRRDRPYERRRRGLR